MASLRISVDCDESHFTPAPDGSVDGQHSWIEHLFDDVQVVSRTRGRLRYKLDFPGDEVLADCLRRELTRLPSVGLAAYSVRTRTALIGFDPDKADEVAVTVALFRGIREFARLHGECDLKHHHHERRRKQAEHDHHHEDGDCDHDHGALVTDAGIRKELFKLGLTGVVLGYFVYKRLKASVSVAALSAGAPLGLTSFITIASGYPIFRDGYNAVKKKGRPTDDTLIGLAVGASLLMGESLTGLSVVWLIQLGRVLEMITLKRSRTAVKELMDITPTEAWRVAPGAKGAAPVTRKVAVESLEKGDIIRVFHGEKVALDGRIVRGRASVRESFLTGESIPREKTAGDTVYAGSVVEAGEIDVEVKSLMHDTVVATMIDAIENLRDRKAPIEKVGTRFAGKFVPISIGLSAVTFLVTRDLRRAITMLVIACPCAAGLATPTAVSATIGQVARKGILVKGGTHLETGARIDTIIFDKTGTLTKGTPHLHRIVETEAGREAGTDECLRLAAAAEQYTTHPLGRVILAEAKQRGIRLAAAESYRLHEGMGIEAFVEEKRVLVGSRRFLVSEGIRPSESFQNEVSGDAGSGETVVYLAVDGELLGAFLVEDPLRPEALETLERLRGLGIRRFLMATGDQRATAESIARRLSLEEVHAELLPQDKLDLVNRLKREGRRVAVMGDGVNDAQALAAADLSIAMGTSRCDVAIETADVTIARDDFRLVAEMFDASQRALRTIYQNFIAAVAINAGGIAYGAMGQLSPFSAAIVHNASTIAVVLNSLRLGKAVGGSHPLGALSEVKV